jgi:predicted nucleic acid-binding protein
MGVTVYAAKTQLSRLLERGEHGEHVGDRRSSPRWASSTVTSAQSRAPFDGLLVAQAIEEGLTVVTHDKAFGAYPVSILWREKGVRSACSTRSPRPR